MAITGQVTLNQLSLLEVDTPPGPDNTPAPVGSVAYYNNGTNGFSYLKVGTANADWSQIITAQFATTAVITAAQRTTTSNVHSLVTDLTSPTLQPGLYRVIVKGLYQSAATGTGIGFRVLNGTSTVSYYALRWSIQQAANGTDQYFEYSQVDNTTNVTSASVVAANTNYLFQGLGYIRVSVAGTVITQFRSETNGTQVLVQPDAIMSLEYTGL